MTLPTIVLTGAAVAALKLTEPGRPEAFGLQWVQEKIGGRASLSGHYRIVDAARVKLLVGTIEALEPDASSDQRKVLAGARKTLAATLTNR